MRSRSPASFHAGVRRAATALLPVLLLQGLRACGPVYRADARAASRIEETASSGGEHVSADPQLAQARPGPQTGVAPDPRRLLGTRALSDNDNLLFNLLLRPDGSAVTAAGSRGPRTAAAGRLSEADRLEVGRWRGWGNGVRVDDGSGWTTRFLWPPVDRSSGPGNPAAIATAQPPAPARRCV